MKIDQDIAHLHLGGASPLAQIRRFHSKAHCLRSRAFTLLVNKIFSFVIHLPQRLVGYRVYRKAYKDLCTVDSRQLPDIGLTPNDLDRVKRGRTGVQAIQQDFAALRVKDALETQAGVDSDSEVTLPTAMAQ